MGKCFRKGNRVDRKLTEEYKYAQAKIIEYIPELEQILQLAEPTTLMYR